ncbi:MAG: hypothetical protein HFP77_00395 [Methylococcales symbiont of Iophon sp. n. MRB-2018]|nr:MAG: hypothetical protein HFP77_00395 [Methylococcales symbiont of Iophon sp. n. MRB-2018]KAF3980757.1 MAG: hypothetical protein HFP76_00435 [Methylococcales symbiont of Iophon sp. n. MRB-2018]
MPAHIENAQQKYPLNRQKRRFATDLEIGVGEVFSETIAAINGTTACGNQKHTVLV